MSSYIFNLYRQDLEFRSRNDSESRSWSWSWHQWRALAHVCQRWRHIIFAWPNYLDVQIHCGSRTAAAKALDVWPALPITIEGMSIHKDGDGIIDVLEHRHSRDQFVGPNGTSTQKMCHIDAGTIFNSTNAFSLLQRRDASGHF